jgi:hypothetical protein
MAERVSTTIASAHLATADSEAGAFPQLKPQFAALFRTEDFQEGQRAHAKGRLPVFKGR